MEPLNTLVEPYRIFWLHTNTPKDLSSNELGVSKPNSFHGNQLLHDKRSDGAWNDGDHYIGVIREHCIGRYGDILVVVEPLIQIESDDNKYKWHRVGKAEIKQFIGKFDECTEIGQIGKIQARFKSVLGEFIILSSDPVHTLMYDWITGKIDE